MTAHRFPLLLLLPLFMTLTAPVVFAQPFEVQNLQIANDKETLSWDVESTAVHYNVYRGYMHDFATDYYGTTLEPEVATTSIVSSTATTPGRGFFYLVTAVNAASEEGSMGSSPTDAERPNVFPWPGYDIAGDWEGPFDWPLVAIHSVMLHTGKVLYWQGGATPTPSYTYDPVTDTQSNQSVFSNLFCAGHAQLPDGRVMVTGGNIPLFNGLSTTFIFDPDTELWEQGPPMRKGRYYPSNVTVGDGSMYTFSGNDSAGAINPEVERYDGTGQGSWNYIPSANKTMTLYPAMHLMPDGSIFHSGPEVATNKFDPATGSWSFVANSNYGKRAGGSGQFNSVMLPPGHDKIMILGGNRGTSEATNTTEIIDFSTPVPAWQYGPPMRFARMHGNVTILPDGNVLASGGGIDGVATNHPAEIYDPVAGTWTMGAMMASFRLYHSTAVLLPDGRVLQAGSNNNPSAEFYSPGYLFRGPRPVIDSSPASVRYGRNFSISSADTAGITCK